MGGDAMCLIPMESNNATISLGDYSLDVVLIDVDWLFHVLKHIFTLHTS